MAFDFNSVMQDAQNSLASGGNGDYKYKLVYPGQGNITIKLLFNPKSNLVKRAINRHTIGEDKIACLKTYGQPCPICKVIEDAQNARGIDLSKMRSQVRGISLAQFVESDYRIDGVQAGDIILFMYPWTVYKDLSGILSQAKSEVELSSLIASNDGYLFTITRGADNKYSTQVNPFKKYRSCQTDEEFTTLLNGLDDLNQMVLSTPLSAEGMKDVTDVTNELTQLYLVQRTPQYQQPAGQQMPMGFGNFGGQPQAPAQGGYQAPAGYPQAPATGAPMGGFTPPATGAPQTQFGGFPQGTGAPATGFPQQNPSQPMGGFPQQNPAPAQTPQYQAPAQQAPAASPFPNQFNNPAGAPQGQPAGQFTPPPPPAQTADPSKPPCFGRHGQEDMNKCLLCPSEIACSQVR